MMKFKIRGFEVALDITRERCVIARVKELHEFQ